MTLMNLALTIPTGETRQTRQRLQTFSDHAAATRLMPADDKKTKHIKV